MRVYLAGTIIGKKMKECLEWRMKIRQHYSMMGWNIAWLDPLNSSHEIGSISSDGLKSSIPSQGIFDRDFLSIQNSDIIVANLDSFGESRPPVGTISEIALAWHMMKPIIVISREEHYVEHPFIKKFASLFCDTVDDLIAKKYINYYFKGIHSAVYVPNE